MSEISLFLESFAKTKMRFRASKHSKNQLQIEEKKGASVSTDFWSSDSVNTCKEQALCCIWIMALDIQSLVSCRAKMRGKDRVFECSSTMDDCVLDAEVAVDWGFSW